ncbi:MAG: hydrolase [Ilumatobacteraceae bacterium]|nr:hydrolase [Ilumatobacteraceae bacterium]
MTDQPDPADGPVDGSPVGSDPDAGIEVRAAGGILWRRAEAGGVEVLVVHRPRYDDWSFAKGKCEPGESFAETAEREVLEETGFSVAFGPALDEVHYHDHKGRSKQVRYWAMTVVSGRFTPNDEVDEARWVSVDEAEALVSYAHDAALLSGLLRAI